MWDEVVEAELDGFLDLSNIRQIESSDAIDALQAAADIAGISRSNIHKAKVIAVKADGSVKQKLRSGETTINREYKKIVQTERKAEQVRRLALACEG